MGTFKSQNCKFFTFPIAIFCKAEERDITGACISKSILRHSTGNAIIAVGKIVFNILFVSEQTCTVEVIWTLHYN